MKVAVRHFAEVALGGLQHLCALGLVVPLLEVVGCIGYLLAVSLPLVGTRFKLCLHLLHGFGSVLDVGIAAFVERLHYLLRPTFGHTATHVDVAFGDFVTDLLEALGPLFVLLDFCLGFSTGISQTVRKNGPVLDKSVIARSFYVRKEIVDTPDSSHGGFLLLKGFVELLLGFLQRLVDGLECVARPPRFLLAQLVA